MDAQGCSASKHSKTGLEATVETYDTSTKAATGVLNAWSCLKKDSPKTKVGISVGGWYDSSYFAAATADK